MGERAGCVSASCNRGRRGLVVAVSGEKTDFFRNVSAGVLLAAEAQERERALGVGAGGRLARPVVLGRLTTRQIPTYPAGSFFGSEDLVEGGSHAPSIRRAPSMYIPT